MLSNIKKILYPAIIILFCAFTFQSIPPYGWYQQSMPYLNGRGLNDITFTDSLTGYAISSLVSDTSYILKTTNGGDNWVITNKEQSANMNKLCFINLNTGFISGINLYRTTNAGLNWNIISSPIYSNDIYFINIDTGWYVDRTGLVGGVYKTTNGGGSWHRQLTLGSSNPSKIYMYNSQIGFICQFNKDRYIRKTTNGGQNWSLIMTNDDFMDIYFADSLTGWKCSVFGMKKTTNGGLNWITQIIPSGGILKSTFIYRFTNINRDTIWGTGGYALYPNNQMRGLLYRTTNGGDNWMVQIPDTSFHIGGYEEIKFTNRLNGWVYTYGGGGVHTVTGGDTTFITGLTKISSEVPIEYKLNQNYPNPFNPKTNIRYEIFKNGYVRLTVYDIMGKEVASLVNQRQNSGMYEVDFLGTGLTSGTYFYTLSVDNKIIDTKKMLMIK